MNSNKIFKNQGGVTLSMETGIDVTTATTHNMRFRAPDNSIGIFVASTSGTKLIYNVQVNDFNQIGSWQMQAFVTKNGVDYYGLIDTIECINALN